jgi:hypothetical protein
LGKDYLDPYLASGARLGFRRSLGAAWTASVRLSAETHRGLTRTQEHALVDDSARFRAVRPVTEGTLTAAELRLATPAPERDGLRWSAAAGMEVGRIDGGAFARPTAEAALLYRTASRAFDGRLRAAAGAVAGDEPVQRRFYIGGPNTLPGYAHRSKVGDAFALADLELARDMWRPWLRLRGLGAAGWTEVREQQDDLVPPPAGPGHGFHASAGVGLGLFWDILRVDAWRPLQRGGEWVILLSAHPDLHSIL